MGRASHHKQGVSLIICSRNRPELLLDFVDSVLRGSSVPDEIVVVDQSNQPNNQLQLLDSGTDHLLRYVWSHTIGASRARNIGVKEAQHDLLVFADDDMLAPPDWFGNIVHALVSAGPDTIVTGQVATAAAAAGTFAPSTIASLEAVVYQGRLAHDVLYTGNMALHRSAFTAVGLFDERLGPGTSFPAAEDNDFGFRLLESGFQIMYVPDVVLYHRAWRQAQAYLGLRWRYGRGQGAYYAKHLRWHDHHMTRRLCSTTLCYTLRSIRALPCRRPAACGDALYLAGLLTGVMQWLLMQHKLRRCRVEC